jgi:AcrR family transcriptional regulator
MPSTPRSRRALDRTLLVLLAALLLFASPLTRWWAQGTPPWHLPYLLWGGLLVLVVLLQRWLARHDARHGPDHDL